VGKEYRSWSSNGPNIQKKKKPSKWCYIKLGQTINFCKESFLNVILFRVLNKINPWYEGSCCLEISE
jgi:hypothetical protein